MVTNTMTINKIVDIFKEWSEAKSPFINDFGFGPIWDFGTSRQMKYPCMWVDLETSSNINITNRKMIPEFNLIVMFLDKENIQDNVDNINGMRSNNVGHIMSDMFQVGQDFINDLILSYANSGFSLVNTVTANKVYDETTDKVYGWAFNFTMQTSVITCKDPSILPPSNCAPAIYKNSDNSYTELITSGSTFIAPDITVTLANEVLTFPSNLDLDLSDYILNEPVTITNSDDTFTTQANAGDNVELLDITASFANNLDVQFPAAVDLDLTNYIFDLPVTISNSNDTYVVTNRAGEFREIPDIDITLGDGIQTFPAAVDINLSTYVPNDPITISNSDDSFTTTALPGTNVELPDINVTLSDGVQTFPSVKNIDLSGYKPINWTRPTDWLPIDSLVNIGNHKFVGLMAIFPDRPNVWVHQSSQAFTVRVDGVATNYNAGTTARGQISYASVSNSTLTSEGFKQVIIEVYPQVAPWTGSFEIVAPGTVIPRMYSCQYIDVRMSAPNITSMFMNTGARMPYLRRWNWLGTHTIMSRALAFNSPVLEEVNEDFSFANNAGFFSTTKLPRILGNITLTNATTATSLFLTTWGNQIIGNVSAPIATTSLNMFSGMNDTEQIGNISLPISTSIFSISATKLNSVGTINIPSAPSFSIICAVLRTLGNITTGNALTSLSGAFNGDRLLENVNISNCTNVTNTANLFTNCNSLKSVILTGLKRGFTIPPSLMDEAAFAALFTSLGTAAGAQTIVITGNITLSAPTIAIATGKGFTITP